MSGLIKGGDLLTVAAIALGASVLAPVVRPRLRPLAKSAVRGALIGLDHGRTAVSKLTLATGDLVAEARHDLGRGDMLISGVPPPKRNRPDRSGAERATAYTWR